MREMLDDSPRSNNDLLILWVILWVLIPLDVILVDDFKINLVLIIMRVILRLIEILIDIGFINFYEYGDLAIERRVDMSHNSLEDFLIQRDLFDYAVIGILAKVELVDAPSHIISTVRAVYITLEPIVYTLCMK